MSTFSSSDILTNLSHLLPTGTFLSFQAIAPLFTNNGECHKTEKIVTGILLGFYFALCFGLSFTDSITTEEGAVYYGIVTRKGLWNPKFRKLVLKDSKLNDKHAGDSYYIGADDRQQYRTQFGDFVNGALNVVAFGALSCLTPPITTCYYPGISQTLVKTGPILAGLFAGVLFAIFPSGRHGCGYAMTTDGTVGVVSNQNGSGTGASGSGGTPGTHDTPGTHGTPGTHSTHDTHGDLELGSKGMMVE